MARVVFIPSPGFQLCFNQRVKTLLLLTMQFQHSAAGEVVGQASGATTPASNPGPTLAPVPTTIPATVALANYYEKAKIAANKLIADAKASAAAVSGSPKPGGKTTTKVL